MVRHRDWEYRYITADDSELDASLEGKSVEGAGEVIENRFRPGLLMAGRTGILTATGSGPNGTLRPLALVVRDEDIRHLCGRYATLRSNLSPLSAWCHLLTPATSVDVDGITHEPRYRDTEGAWSGVVVAEAMLLAQKPVVDLRFSACLATATYAIARTVALWKDMASDDVVERLDSANRLCRGRSVSQRNEARISKIRSSLRPIWACLVALTKGVTSWRTERCIQPLATGLMALAEARVAGSASEAAMLVRPLLGEVPEAKDLERIADMTPEERLRIFDVLVEVLRDADAKNSSRRNALALVAGYLATVAAGGTPSLGILKRSVDQFPEITLWAYLVGGIGEKVTWTSAFDGLGRLVARELGRPLRLDEPPTCDFAFDEAVVLVDSKLDDPLVQLKVKQARLVSVALFPGVNVAIPVSDATIGEDTSLVKRTGQGEVSRQSENGGELLPLLAEALWPFIETRVSALKERDSTPGNPRSRSGGRSRRKSRWG